jgi:hypothetical protein
MPIDRYQDEIQTSIRGNDLGFDNQRRLAGMTGNRIPTEFSTAASTLDERGGFAMLSGSTDVWTLRAPLAAGVEKIIANVSTVSTATQSVVRSTALGACSFSGTTVGSGLAGGGVRINLLNSGSAVRLVSASSAVWVPVSFGTTLYYTNSTSS